MYRILEGDAMEVLRTLATESVQCVVTSPPYWNMRDYKIAPSVWLAQGSGVRGQGSGDPACEHRFEFSSPTSGTNYTGKRRWQHTRNGRDELQPVEKRVGWLRQNIEHCQFCRCGAWRGCLGLEPTPELYVEHMVQVFREVRRVLRKDGTLWLNMGDSYGSRTRSTRDSSRTSKHGYWENPAINKRIPSPAKQLLGMPWMLAFALRADGWWLRQDIVWSKPNPMPESVTDRCTKAHEYLFLLTKHARYYYDQEAIKELAIGGNEHDLTGPAYAAPGQTRQTGSRKIKMPDGWDTGAGGHGSHHRDGREKGQYRMVGAGRASGNKTRESREQGTGIRDQGKADDIEVFTDHCALTTDHWSAATRNKRSVWEIATQPFPQAHFATFPEALVEPCILAGTSEHGCCPECGAPWRRVFDKKLVPTAKAAHTFVLDDRDQEADVQDQGSNRQKDGHRPGWANRTETTGWQPTCKCSHSSLDHPSGEDLPAGALNAAMNGAQSGTDPCCLKPETCTTPCVVLDPFAGSGTTGVVALRWGREFIGIEQSAEYAGMARRRIEEDAPLFNKAANQQVSGLASQQAELFSETCNLEPDPCGLEA